MTTVIPYECRHESDVVELSLEAWMPVFASMREVVGNPMFRRMFGTDWREYQAADVRRALSEYLVSVAVISDRIAGFCAVDLPDEATHGEIYMLAVAPEFQGRGTQGGSWPWSTPEEIGVTRRRGRSTRASASSRCQASPTTWT
jgi:GNAT superfamily N-acetyltransferase